jgi:hypothetical protein
LTPLHASTRNQLTPLYTSTINQLPPLYASIRNQLTPLHAFIRNQLTPLYASIRNQLTPLHASIRNQLTPLHASIRNQLTSLHTSIRHQLILLQLLYQKQHTIIIITSYRTIETTGDAERECGNLMGTATIKMRLFRISPFLLVGKVFQLKITTSAINISLSGSRNELTPSQNINLKMY